MTPPARAPSAVFAALALLFLAAGLAEAQGTPAPAPFRTPVGPVYGPVPVLDVVDGDTVVLGSNLGPRTVRLIGIDTPEVDHPEIGREPFGPEASAFTRDLLPPGTRVRVELDLEVEDAYGRLLAYLYVEDPGGGWRVDGAPHVMANLAIARSGWAHPLTIPPNGVYADLIADAVAEAEAAGRGLHAPEGEPVPRAEAASTFGGAAPGAAGGPVRIACILYDPSAELDRDAEWVEVEILEPVDTRGMYLLDRGSGARFPLPAGVQGPGTLTIGNPDQGVWNNSGDTVYLMRGPDEELDSFTYEPTGGQDDVVCR